MAVTPTGSRASRHELLDFLPCPLVGWEQLVAVAAPGMPVTRSRVRTLKQQDRVSAGVKVAKHGPRGLEGASTYHSVLSLWAERARMVGWDTEAHRLTTQASGLEARFAGQIREFLGRHPFEELSTVDFFWVLAEQTGRVLAESRVWRGCVVAVAEVTDVEGGFARLRGRSMDGDERAVDLPIGMLERNHLGLGDSAFVVSRLIGGAALVEVEAALLCPAHRNVSPTSGDYVATAENTAKADASPAPPRKERTRDRRYADGPGAALTPEAAAAAWAAARRVGLTARPLRLAG